MSSEINAGLSDELDGCSLDFTIDAVDDETVALLPLFPQGADTPNLDVKAAEWAEVFGPGG